VILKWILGNQDLGTRPGFDRHIVKYVVRFCWRCRNFGVYWYDHL